MASPLRWLLVLPATVFTMVSLSVILLALRAPLTALFSLGWSRETDSAPGAIAFILFTSALPPYLGVLAGGRTAPTEQYRTGQVLMAVLTILLAWWGWTTWSSDPTLASGLSAGLALCVGAAAMFGACVQLRPQR